ncbi:alpha/beta fold hydrolase [uncultured Shewanella sp.]|uniref:alpha/beta fold hydrolase n=1 Tax=Shewanella atlantica TaxID=271099 RepID=UPI002631B90B|nr:alpha/beta fold hydrolase [uncultured Shewanella sp.]
MSKTATRFILIRGLFREQRHWGGFPALLSETFPDAEVICVDVPGAGRRYMERSPLSMEAMVHRIREGIELIQPVNIIGISMGGMIGLRWAEMYPAEINSIVCINTSAKKYSHFYERLRPQSYFRIIQAICSGVELRERVIYSLVSNRRACTKVIEEWVSYAQEYPISTINFVRQLLAAVRFDITRPPSCRLLFISSTNDNLVSHDATRAIAQSWHTPLVVNTLAGHDVPLDAPQWLCDEVRHFLTQG